MQRVLLFIFLSIFTFSGFAQNQKLDSLINSLNNQKIDSNIYFTSLKIAKIYADSSYNKALIYFNKALDAAEKLSNRKKVAHIYHQIGYMYLNKGEFPTALVNLNNALEIHEYLNNKKGIGQLLNDIGLIYKTWGKYDKAIENYLSALKLFDEMGDAVNGAMASNNIGQIYYYRGDYVKSIEYFEKYLDINKKNKVPRAVAGAANNIASAYLELNKLDSALDYYVRSMRIYDSLGIKVGVAIIKDNIGSLFIREKKYNDALLYNSEALKIFEEIGSQARLCTSLQCVGLAYSKLNQPDLALQYLNRCLDLAIKLKQKETQKDVYETLSDVYVQKKQFEKALLCSKLFNQIKDSLINSETIGKIETVQAEYEAQKKEKELAGVNQQLHNEKIFVLISAGLFIIFIFLTFLIINENQHKKKIIKKSTIQIDALNDVLGKMNQILINNQNSKKALTSILKNSWCTNSDNDDTCTCLPLVDNSFLLVAFISKGKPSDNIEIVRPSIFDFFHSFDKSNSSVSIKDQYYNFISNDSIWNNVILDKTKVLVDFWCYNKDTNEQMFSGILGAFHLGNHKNTADSIINNNWIKVNSGDKFFFYATNRFSELIQSDQKIFQDTLIKTIDKTTDLPFDEQKEIFSNSLELISAGNEVFSNISIIAFSI